MARIEQAQPDDIVSGLTGKHFKPMETIEVEQEESKSVFPPDYVLPLKGLLFLGALEKDVEYGGHVFHIRTLKEGEVLRIGMLCKDHKGYATEMEAYKAYTVAACIETVDGEYLYQQYKSGVDYITEHFNVVKDWYPSVITAVYNAYVDLEVSAIEVANALKK